MLSFTAAVEVAGRHTLAELGLTSLRSNIGRWARTSAVKASPTSIDALFAALRDLGVGGRDLLVHSSWEALQGVQAKPSSFIEALRQLAGEGSTLLAPTHPIEKLKDGLLFYDVERTPTRMGLLSEALRRTPGALRSPMPIAPIAAVGPAAAEYTADFRDESGGTPYGVGSPYWRLAQRGGQVVVLGVPWVRALTLLHVAFDILGDDNPIASFHHDVSWFVVRGGQTERWTVLPQRPKMERYLATYAFRQRAERAGVVRTISHNGIPLALVDAARFIEWHLPLARTVGLPYWHAPRRQRVSR